MEADYFSVEAFLAENQKIQCTFTQSIPEMGHLGGGTERDIVVDSKLQLPIWLVYTIIYSDWADFMIPAAFGPRVRNALNAEAHSVRLSSLVGAGGLWYGFGKTIMDMVNDEQGASLSQLLKGTFNQRLVEIVDQAQHFAVLGPVGGGAGATGDSAQSFREGLDATERELFTLAQDSAKKTRKWYDESDKGRR